MSHTHISYTYFKFYRDQIWLENLCISKFLYSEFMLCFKYLTYYLRLNFLLIILIVKQLSAKKKAKLIDQSILSLLHKVQSVDANT